MLPEEGCGAFLMLEQNRVDDVVLDDLDRRIIAELQTDGRMPFSVLAEKVDSSPS
ncbi:AsnC family transcriptional regulator, partial [Corynebacterium argentoratense]|uniref:AsnC family transcriptional regulator n=1 Tax=Corynebacterium argentoratense TaxID=42817 RepID=UPI003994FE2E